MSDREDVEKLRKLLQHERWFMKIDGTKLILVNGRDEMAIVDEKILKLLLLMGEQ